MNVTVHTCAISKGVNQRTYPDRVDRIHQDVSSVSVDKNPILQELLKWFNIWDTNPIFYVNNQPYRMELISKTETHAEFYQMSIKWINNNTGYDIINKRRVVVTYTIKNPVYVCNTVCCIPMAC